MIFLTLNRNAGCNFVRFMARQGFVVKEAVVPGENQVVLTLDPFEVKMFRAILTAKPQHFENAEGILKMLGTHTNE